MGKPHIHAELIKAWADGAKIQFLDSEGFWLDCCTDSGPGWKFNLNYRIKPEEKKPVVRWLWASKDGYVTNNLYSEDGIKVFNEYTIKLEWSRTEFPE